MDTRADDDQQAEVPGRTGSAAIPPAGYAIAELDPTDRAGLAEVVALEAAGWFEVLGTDDLAVDLDVWASNLTPTPYRERTVLIARHLTTGRIDGYVMCSLRLREDTDLLDFELQVRSECRRRGIGRALLAAAQEFGARSGRTRAMTYCTQREAAPGDPEALIPATGSGRVPADSASTRFALATGHRLEQTERHSVLDLPVDIEGLWSTLGERTAGYRFRTWTRFTPEDLLEPLAALRSQMSVDVPTGELPREREIWDAERVRRADQRVADSGSVVLFTVAERIADGELAAYTVLEQLPSRPQVAHQGDTFVLASHRGHGLGLAVKLVNHQAAVAAFDRLQRVHTWNAEENRWMLEINQSLGYRPLAVESVWARQF
ncbi:GNAT family N-acetyltransferase [Naumannella halotolerans]|uniref:N-acetyltransferase domain-containing protein n=1 Tax=Naumannella halotolerans TaxID=993414 RepID=A0A4R7JCT4_9ACTN|nr:GNAT family N-acetyltransferase [Naumannella halotolerans]TDT34279.1 hypothetical protein CLV29_1937 [Naumannella halotolerans]